MKRLAPVFAWIVALASLVGAAQELRRERESSDIGAALAAVPQLNIKSASLALADYQAIQKKTAVFGTVGLVVDKAGLGVKAGALSDYAAWRLTIDQILLENSGVTWRIDYLCSGKCPSGDAHRALLSGTRLSAGI